MHVQVAHSDLCDLEIVLRRHVRTGLSLDLRNLVDCIRRAFGLVSDRVKSDYAVILSEHRGFRTQHQAVELSGLTQVN